MLAFSMPGLVELIIISISVLIVLLPVTIVVSSIVVLARQRNALRTNPNLKPCPDCGRFVSLRAANCPHCGSPIQTE